MNKIYKVIYCKATQTFVAVSEFAKGYGKNGVRGSSRQVAATMFAGVLKPLTLAMLIGLGGLSNQAVAETCVLDVTTTSTGGSPYSPAYITSVTVDNGGAASADASSLACGSDANAKDRNTIAIGKGALAGTAHATNRNKGNGAIAIGINTQATNRGAIAVGGLAHAEGEDSSAFGSNTHTVGKRSTAIGYDTTTYTRGAIAIGEGAVAGHATDANKKDAIAIGTGAKATGNQSISIGTSAKATGNQSISIGIGNNVQAARSGAIGDPTTIIASATDSYSIGNNNNVNTADTFVMGNNVTTTVADSIYLGKGAAASSALSGSSAGTTDYSSVSLNGTTYKYAGGVRVGGTDVVGVVSVGSVGNERRIQNVAAGLVSATSTDAINGSQLFALQQFVLNGWDVQVNSNTPPTGGGGGGTPPGGGSGSTQISPGDTLDIVQGNNIAVSFLDDGKVPSTTKVTISTQKNVNFDSITLNNPVDITNGGNKTKAVSAGDVKTYISGRTFKLTGDQGTGASQTLDNSIAVVGDNNITTKALGAAVEIKLNKNIDLGNSGSIKMGNTLVDDNGIIIQGGPSITRTAGINAGGQRITHVAPGFDPSDAVNVSQLRKAEGDLYQTIENNRSEARAGIAGAAAMSLLGAPFTAGKSAVSAAVATHEGETALAVGLSAWSDNGRWLLRGALSQDSQSQTTAGGSATYSW